MSLPSQSNRPASRRLHRRAEPALPLPCTALRAAPPRLLTDAPQTLMPLARAVVREAGMLELMAAEMRIAELEIALAEAREAASIDPLTGALNRRGFEQAFERELARSRRNGAGLALALIDLDNFKRLNDRHGHLAGDQALVHLVRVVHAALRPSDIFSRFGGEEFVLLLPETALADAEAAIARIQRQLAAQPLSGREIVLTFSAGVVVQQAGESLAAFIARADAATYAAKRAGKNCVVSA